MKFLILSMDYPEFLRWLYGQHSGLEGQFYEEQMRARAESLFGVADFYSDNLRKLGHEAYDIHANNEFMQKAWAREHKLKIARRWQFRLRRGIVPWVSPAGNGHWTYDILAAQIKHHRPDVLLNQAMDGISNRFLKEIKPDAGLLVGQHAAPLPENEDYSCHDLVISSLPNFVDHFRQLGIKSELHRLAFEPQVLEGLDDAERDISVSFVGSLSEHHAERIQLLEYLGTHLDIAIWGPGVESLPETSAIRRHHQGNAWGREMYRILRRSKIALNHHIGVAASYANNCRLYEATGAGAMLITDWKENLHEIFEPGKEVAAYHNAEECVELIKYYLKHDNEREAIARAGQQRTLQEHTYQRQMKKLIGLIQKHF